MYTAIHMPARRCWAQLPGKGALTPSWLPETCVWEGSDPAACIDQLASAGVQGVYGNTEQYLRAPDQIPPDELHRSIWDIIQPAVYWTLDRLSEAQRGWLFGLPFEQTVLAYGQSELTTCWWCMPTRKTWN